MDLCELARAGISDNGIEKIGWLFVLFSSTGFKRQAMIMKGSKFRTDKTNMQMNLSHNLCAEDIVMVCNANPHEIPLASFLIAVFPKGCFALIPDQHFCSADKRINPPEKSSLFLVGRGRGRGKGKGEEE